MATIKAGTYVFVEAPTMPSARVQLDFDGKAKYTRVNSDGSYQTELAANVYGCNGYATNQVWDNYQFYVQYGGGIEYVVYGANGWRFYNDDDMISVTDTTKLRTIKVLEDVTGVPDDFYTWFTANTISNKLSVDLTTLPGWANLSSGNHVIKLKAKGSNYRDSELSEGVTVSKPEEVYTDCLTFTGESSEFTLAVGSDGAKEWDGTVWYSTDHNTWNVWDGTAISSANKKLYLRGKNNTTFYTSKGARLSLSAKAGCSGNIQTLIDWESPPTSILATGCYRLMFAGCTNLTVAPDLPATTLQSSCYRFMFQSCVNLITAPALPATTLATSCYMDMFQSCTNLTIAPELPATILASFCYANMFNNCSNLKISAAQDSTYKTAWRIPSSGTISSEPSSWNGSMLQSTGGAFTSNPSINTTYYGAW